MPDTEARTVLVVILLDGPAGVSAMFGALKYLIGDPPSGQLLLRHLNVGRLRFDLTLSEDAIRRSQKDPHWIRKSFIREDPLLAHEWWRLIGENTQLESPGTPRQLSDRQRGGSLVPAGSGDISRRPTETDVDFARTATLSLDQVAAALAISRSGVLQLVRDGWLLGVRRDGLLQVPAAFIQGNGVVLGLAGVVVLLRDGGYSDDEILRWLFTNNDSIPGTPIDALRAGRLKEIRRRVQDMVS
ncbi:hypothetical protein PSU4_37410 [Pseudonocardia sulfidoxydans NBRC 16205]|uniref:Uncharacterized protein n=1 Tax=Pseudonocardia sulfidoxydans NBRC 16205 TaxID=1223511 RepID=A0A511DK30_9PSEU|nr:hypothetical protein PSU4_37410 [Pseudonocardia sulfidoxydans NBRC 16205]